MKLKLQITIAAFTCSLGLFSQTTDRTCGPVPSMAWDNWFNQKVAEHKQQTAVGKSQMVPQVLPVIVHIIHGGAGSGSAYNISQAQVNSQIAVLNADFAGSGYNVSNVPTAFAPLVANTDISFSPVMLDPNGVALQEPGIDRIDYHTIPGASNPGTITSIGTFMSHFDQVIKPATIWDPTRYFNIWVSDVKSNVYILGYATFPSGSGLSGAPPGGGTATTDGIWVGARFFGTVGSLTAPFNKGRTATHEIGHYLGLRHIDGDANCGNDYCNDTPTQQTLNYGCPNPKTSCGNPANGEMFMNFMDYCDDPCLYMFTNDQKSRMQTAIANSPYRTLLTSSSQTLCNLAPEVASADFVAQNEACMDSVVQLTNASTGLPGPMYSWSVTPAGATFFPGPTSANPTLVFNAPGSYIITLEASNSAGTNYISSAITVNDCGNITGIYKNVLDNSLTLFPNPSRGFVTMSWNPRFQGSTFIHVRDYTGREVYYSGFKFEEGNLVELDLKELSNGVYIVTVQNGYETAVKKLILDK